jgi:hypothetical protein
MIKVIGFFILMQCVNISIAYGESLKETSHAPTPIAQAFPGQSPLGKSALYAFVFKLYDIALWAKSVKCAESFSCTMALETIQNLGASKETLVSKTLEKITYYHPELLKGSIEIYRKRLEDLYPERVNSGDTIQVLFNPEENLISFYHKGKSNDDYTLKGSVKDGEFARHFFEIWLHPKCVYGKLREELLGLAKP